MSIVSSWSARALDRRDPVVALGNGELAHAFDEIEDLLTRIGAHDVAEQTAEQADVIADRGLRVAGGHATG